MPEDSISGHMIHAVDRRLPTSDQTAVDLLKRLPCEPAIAVSQDVPTNVYVQPPSRTATFPAPASILYDETQLTALQ